jgi:Flp pilus assembly protein TadG
MIVDTLPSDRRAAPRRGFSAVLLVVLLIPVLACVALAIDLGLLAAARTQISDAADAAAMAGARTLNGVSSSNNNYANVVPNMNSVIQSNSVLGTALTSAQLTANIGRYVYNTSAQQFQGQFPGPSTSNWSLVQATVTANPNTLMSFSKVFNITVPNLQATAAAAHRPRDICLIVDFSGSMRFGSLLGLPYSGDRTSNNQDTLYPAFGAYSAMGSDLLASAATSPYENANITTTTSDGRAPIVQDFYTSSSGGAAFTAQPSSYATTPGGDNYLKITQNKGSTYAQTLSQIVKTAGYDSTFETKGYKDYTGTTFNKYTTGPGYYGKTFYVWPPDPLAANDWRQLYFGTNDNSKLWDSSGNFQTPSTGGYTVNYTAILNWLTTVGPNPFPSRLQSGRIVYYTAIPTTINTATWPPTDLNQRFWKDYIDYVLGFMQTGTGSYTDISTNASGLSGYGNDQTWGTVKITAKASIAKVGGKTPYMNYTDNPQRPLLSFWFGPLTMIDFLGNYNLWYSVSPNCSRYCWWPGTCHESPMYECKLGLQAALEDMNNNHPNDQVSLIYFSTPASTSTDTAGNRFNRVRVGLGQNFSNMEDSLWYPPATVGNSSATVTPYDSNNIEVPRAQGGTCYAYPLMLAYNQFSSNTSLQTYNTAEPAGDAGGNGRVGAQKILIFETDGAPNTTASANFTNGGSYKSYYNIRYNSASPGSSDYPSGVNGYGDNDPTVTSQIYTVCNQLAGSSTGTGFSTGSKPMLIHCLAFGPLGPNAVPTLAAMQSIGNVTDGMPAYKQINGDQATIVSDLQTAIATILQNGVQVSLIQ